MTIQLKAVIALLSAALISQPAFAKAKFKDGPVIKGYGKHTPVIQTADISADAKFKVVFDVSKQGEKGKVNRRFESLARFLNMHVANGVRPENIELALVVHGKAGFDLLNDQAFKLKYQQNNPNTALINLLAKHQTSIYICGQSAGYMGIENENLNAHVNVSLSAMTANAQLQQQGYTLNPF